MSLASMLGYPSPEEPPADTRSFSFYLALVTKLRFRPIFSGSRASRGLDPRRPIINFWPMGRNNWTYWNSLGYWGSSSTPGAAGTDTIHLSDAGHAYVSSILQLLVATGI